MNQLKEYPQSYQIVNHRKTIKELTSLFCNIDFQEIKADKDKEWQNQPLPNIVEQDKLLYRIYDFKKWIRNRRETKIAIIGQIN